MQFGEHRVREQPNLCPLEEDTRARGLFLAKRETYQETHPSCFPKIMIGRCNYIFTVPQCSERIITVTRRVYGAECPIFIKNVWGQQLSVQDLIAKCGVF